jgi:hypothetical protein
MERSGSSCVCQRQCSERRHFLADPPLAPRPGNALAGSELTMSDITREISLAVAHLVPQPEPFIHRIWPRAVVGIALSATTLWTCLLGYEVARLVMMLI